MTIIKKRSVQPVACGVVRQLASLFASAAALSSIVLSCFTADVACAEGNGRLFLVNPISGAYISAGVDQEGNYQFKASGSYSYLVGAYELFSTPSALVAYRPSIGGAAAFLVDGRSNATIAPIAAGFSANWSIIRTFGNFLFFYGISGSSVGAVVRVNPDGTFTQTLSGSFSPWTDIEATDNYLFFYNKSTGVQVVGMITSDGKFTQSGFLGGGATYAGYTLVASVGDDVLLYNANTGSWESGEIKYTGSANQDYFSIRAGFPGQMGLAKLPLGFNESVASNGHLMLYNSTTGQALIGHFNQENAVFTTDHTLILPKYYTSLVSCGQYLFFYGLGTGTFQTGYLTGDGNFLSRQSGFRLGIEYYGVAATKN